MNDREQTSGDAGAEAAVPAQAGAREQQRLQRFFTGVLRHVQQLRADQAGDHTNRGRINGINAHVRSLELTVEDPQADQHAKRHQDTETADVESCDTANDGIHEASSTCI